MPESIPGERRAGTWRKTSLGYKAFHPNPLPPAFGWTPGLIAALSDADSRLGLLAGGGRRLPNPYLLIRSFVRREAVLSSRIEGTRSTLGELLAAEAGIAVERSPDDLREVGNYVAALDYGLRRLKTLPLSLRLVRELHTRLMSGTRGRHSKPGEFRRSQNWIGEPGCTLANAVYVPPPPDETLVCLTQWERFLHDESMPPLVHAALLHYQFEAIHPFLDGNGRVGRLLIILFLAHRGVLPLPLLYLSAFFEATRSDYYERLRGVTERGDWERWLQYFFNGVARQSEDALSRAERINRLLEGWRGEVVSLPTKAAVRLIDVIGSNPYVTPRRVEKTLGVAYNTAVAAIRRLEKRGILIQVGVNRRGRVFCARRILGILEEPARLKP